MYTSTSKTFLYYKYNNIYFKVPTYGYLFKIIDFGRSIFNFHNRFFIMIHLKDMVKQKVNIQNLLTNLILKILIQK